MKRKFLYGLEAITSFDIGCQEFAAVFFKVVSSVPAFSKELNTYHFKNITK